MSFFNKINVEYPSSNPSRRNRVSKCRQKKKEWKKNIKGEIYSIFPFFHFDSRGIEKQFGTCFSFPPG